MKKIFSMFAAVLMAGSLMAGRAFTAGEVLYQKTSAVNWWCDGGAHLRAIFDETDTIIGVSCGDGAHYAYTITEAKTYSTVVFDRASSDHAAAWNATGAISLDGTTENCVDVFAQNSSTVTWVTFDPENIHVEYRIKHPFDGSNWVFKTCDIDNGDGTYSLRDTYGAAGCNVDPLVLNKNYVANPTLVGAPAKGDSCIFTVNPAATTEAEIITITKIETEGPGPEPTLPQVDLKGINNDWAGVTMVAAEDKLTCSYTHTLTAGEHEFKVYVEGGTWLGNNGTMTRENCTDWVFDTAAGNCHLTADVDGDYVFTYTYETRKVSVTFPENTATGINNIDAATATKVVRGGQIYILREGVLYNVNGAVVR